MMRYARELSAPVCILAAGLAAYACLPDSVVVLLLIAAAPVWAVATLWRQGAGTDALARVEPPPATRRRSRVLRRARLARHARAGSEWLVDPDTGNIVDRDGRRV